MNLLDKISAFSNIENPVSKILMHDRGVHVLSFANLYALYLAQNNPKFKDTLLSSTLLLRDGIGCALIMRRDSRDPGINLNGTDLIPIIMEQILKKNRHFTVGLFGTEKHALSRAAERISALGAKKVICINGFKPAQEYVKIFVENDIDIVLLGMGMPKQEFVTEELRSVFDSSKPCWIINGGAIIDYIGGSKRRAPYIIRLLRLEWFYRMASEPRRLFYRNVVTLSFLVKRLVWGVN